MRCPGARAAIRPGGGRLGVAVGDHRPLLAVGAVVLVAVTLISAATPPQARAASVLGIDINPLNWPGEILGCIGGDIAKLAVGAFDAPSCGRRSAPDRGEDPIAVRPIKEHHHEHHCHEQRHDPEEPTELILVPPPTGLHVQSEVAVDAGEVEWLIVRGSR